jgi:hypothetical protein
MFRRRIGMKFKVGDKVRVRTKENLIKEYGTDSCNNVRNDGDVLADSMEQYCGKVVTISKINPKIIPVPHDSYMIEEITDSYHWYDWMFENEKVESEFPDITMKSPCMILMNFQKLLDQNYIETY